MQTGPIPLMRQRQHRLEKGTSRLRKKPAPPGRARTSAVENWCELAETARFRPAALARFVGVSLRALESFFQARTGGSVRDWLNELRLRLAAQRLATGAAVTSLVNELGYCNASHFRRQFRDLFGCAPRDFAARCKHRQGARTAEAAAQEELALAVRSLENRLRRDEGRHPEPADRKVRIVLVDDEPKTHRAVGAAFNLLAPDWRLEGHPASKDVLRALAQKPPDAVLLGCRKSNACRFDFLAAISTCLPGLALIMFADSPAGEEILSALAAGAAGYVLKTAPPHQLVYAIREVLQDGAFLCSQAKQAVLSFFHAKSSRQEKSRLTAREREVCVLLLKDTKKEVAVRLNLETKTVETLANRAFKKLGVHGRTALLNALTAVR